jgi:hypothetical protein
MEFHEIYIKAGTQFFLHISWRDRLFFLKLNLNFINQVKQVLTEQPQSENQDLHQSLKQHYLN